MEQKYPDVSEITLESFDAMEDTHEYHEFSKGYMEKKMRLLEELRGESAAVRTNKGNIRRRWIAAAVAAALLLAMPAAVNAAADGGLFRRIWGRGEEANIASHVEVIEGSSGGEVEVTYPEREYVELSQEEADKLLGDQSFEPVEVQLGDTKMTVQSIVRDERVFVVAYTLEREGGVDMLEYDRLTNESKGAGIAKKAKMSYHFGSAGSSSFTYVDLEASTPEKLVCCDYVIMGAAKERSSINLTAYEYGTCFGDYSRTGDSVKVAFTEKIRCGGETLRSCRFVSDRDSTITLSPIAMKLDRIVNDDVPEEFSTDPYAAYYTAIRYKDGTEYVVEQHDYYDIAAFDKETDNCIYSLGELDGGYLRIFNRLVDAENIDYIIVNETTYRLG